MMKKREILLFSLQNVYFTIMLPLQNSVENSVYWKKKKFTHLNERPYASYPPH